MVLVTCGRAAILCLAMLTSPAQSELVIVKEGGKEYHWPGCDVIKDGKDVLALTRAQANGRGLKAHAACHPENVAQRERSPKASTPVVVYLDGTRYYHTKDCRRLGSERKKLKLEEAGKKYWPCPVCKPPIRKRRVS